jgi:hypothetical protein
MRVKSVETTKLQVTVDVVTDRLIGEIAELGIHGVNKSEVASSIIRMWLWDNQGRLRDSGVQFKLMRSGHAR